MLQASRLLVAAAFLLCTGTVHAAQIGFTVDFTGSTLALTNDSAVAQITAYTISIGDTAFSFDRAETVFEVGSGSFVLVSPDAADDGVGSDDLSYTFTGFDPADRLASLVDIDPDSGNSDLCCTIHGVMFNNGAAPNSIIAVTFSNGFILDGAIPDTAQVECALIGDCQFRVAFDFPEPGMVLLLGLTTAALLVRRARA